MNDRVERLERHLQAMSALNRELHARLGGARRSAIPDEWVETLASIGAGEVRVARSAAGVFVIEGGVRRAIASSLLAAAIAERFGHGTWMDDAELNSIPEGPPVEVLEGPYGLPFLVVGGRRLPLRGLPLPHPVTTEQMQLFPQYDDLNVAAANMPRARWRFQIYRVRSVVTRKGGVMPAARTAVERIRGRLRTLMRRRRP